MEDKEASPEITSERRMVDFRQFSEIVEAHHGIRSKAYWSALRRAGLLVTFEEPLYEVSIDEVPEITTPSWTPTQQNRMRHERYEKLVRRSKEAIDPEALDDVLMANVKPYGIGEKLTEILSAVADFSRTASDESTKEQDSSI